MAKQNTILTVRDQIADQLRADMIAGFIKPGERLREEELADRFGVSRGPIRDVLIQLSKEGLLRARRNAGVTVNDLPNEKTQKLLIEIRQSVELFALDILIGKLTDENFDLLASILNELGDALKKGDFTRATSVDISFHKTLVELAGGDDLLNIWTPVAMRMRMNYQRISSPDQSIREHQDILDALRVGDKKAAARALKANIR